MVEIGKTLPQQLHERLRKLISETEPGGRLPSEPKLAKQLGVSRATLREAMRIFETQGVIHRRQGVGTFVIPPSQVIETGLEVLESILTQAKRKDLPIVLIDNWLVSLVIFGAIVAMYWRIASSGDADG